MTKWIEDSSCGDCGAENAEFDYLYRDGSTDSICKACAPQYQESNLKEKGKDSK